jgi:hypothetical protein
MLVRGAHVAETLVKLLPATAAGSSTALCVGVWRGFVVRLVVDVQTPC